MTLLAVEPGFDTENLKTADIQIASDKYPDASQRILFFSSQRMAMYSPYMQFPTLTMCVGVRTAIDPVSLAAEMRDAVWKSDHDVPVTGIESMEAITARSVSDNKVVAFSVALFAAVAVLLAALGIYGALACYVNRRQHEIGIKVALGADRGQVLRPILSRGLSLVVVGIVLGLVGAFWTARVLQRLLFDVAPTDLPTFVFVSLFFGCVALVACLISARRALRVDPVAVLGVE